MMEPLPDSRIDLIPKTPEHMTSEAIRRPAPYPEDRKYLATPEQWAALVEKYGGDKVKQFYRLGPAAQFTAAINVRLKPPVAGNG